jgi:superfamily II DNA or RNA helicase
MAKADALKTLLTGVMSRVPIRWGLTGTIPKEKFESQSLLVSIGPVISQLAASELQDRGVLAQCHVNIVQLVDHAEFTNYQSELKYLLEEENRLKTIANLVRQVNTTGNTLVLVDRIAAGQALVAQLNDAVFVSGSTKAGDRQSEYDEALVRLLWRLTVWPLWVLIFLGFLIWFFWNPEKALSGLYNLLGEVLGKRKTRTM